MDIDTTQPWGVAIDYFGRATITENGHTVQIRVYDQTLGEPLAPDPLTGKYPPVSVTAELSEHGDGDCLLRGYGEVMLSPSGTGPVVPDQTSVQTAVSAAVTDFQARTAAYAALCAAWTTDTSSGGSTSGATGSTTTSTTTSGGTATA
jgi:hypothetical protein